MSGIDGLFVALWCCLIAAGIALAVWHDNDHHGR